MFASAVREVREGPGKVVQAKGLRDLLPAPLLISMLGHALLVAIVALGLSRRDAEELPAGPTLISVDVTFRADVRAEIGSEPEPDRAPPPSVSQTSVSESRPAPSDPVTTVAASEKIWRPLDPRIERALELQQLMNLAACPRFDEPAGRLLDPDLEEKCARVLEGLRKGPGSELVAAKAARRQERRALDLGWAEASVPKLSPDALEAQTSPHKTYAEEAFGPWPWDEARRGGE